MTDPIVTAKRPTPIGEEISLRLMMFIFAFLCWQCANIILRPITEGHIYLILLCLLAVPEMVLTALLFGDKSITWDINELNFYGLLCHLIALPVYFQGIPSIYHNTAIYVILALMSIRLLYLGPRNDNGEFKGLPTFGVLGFARQWMAKHQNLKENPYFHHWTSVLFFGSALPIWFIMIRTNDPMITAAIATLMVFIFMIARLLQTQFDALQRAAAAAAKAAAARAELPTAPPPEPLSAPLQQILIAIPQEIARQLLEAHHAMHPNVQVLNVAFSKYLARAYPDDDILNPSSLAARRHDWLKQIVELHRLAEMQMLLKQGLGIETDDIARFSVAFQNCFSFDLRAGELRSHIQYVLDAKNIGFSDATMQFSCDLLITAWLHILLQCDNEYMEHYAELDALTRSFVSRFDPHGHDKAN